MAPSSTPRVLTLVLALTAACGPTIQVEEGSADGTGTDDATTGGPDAPGPVPIVEVPERDLDILFVVDNSGSMGEEQVALAQSVGSVVALLDEPYVAVDYRIGFTTTDNGNPWCQATTPEAGALRLTSCRRRPEEFVFDGATTIDLTQEACYDLCPEQWSEIDIRPTAAFFGDSESPRNWFEKVDGESNLPEGLDAEQAFRCFAPQGIDGCGFESPLEAMRKALLRSSTVGEADFGFLRDGAALLIVIVTDEVDCSYNPEHDTIFLPGGNRVFWSDPEAPAPTSALCWNAGVACTGAGTYDECVSVNLDVDGLEVDDAVAEDRAVLRPVSRYIDFVQEIEDAKQLLNPDREVLVSVIAGVDFDGSVTYQDSRDPQFQDDFGIGPGCSSASGSAVPPVRLAEFADAFEVADRSLYSICDVDYSPAFEQLFGIPEQLRPGCMPYCVADSNPGTEVVDPECTVTEQVPVGDGSFTESAIVPCAAGELPPGADSCYVTLVGEQLDDYCADGGHNLQFQLVRREGIPVLGGTVILAECVASETPDVDCPQLP